MTNSIKLMLGVSAIVIVGALFYFLMTRREELPVATTSAIKIGFIAPLTGDAAVYGIPGKNVVALAAREINDAGGVNGRPLEVIYEDGKCDGQAAAQAMQKLATVDHVSVVIGGFCSSESLAAVPVAAASGVAMLSPGSSSPELTGISPFFQRAYPSDSAQGKVLADAAATSLHEHKVAFLQEQLDYPLGIYQAFTSRFQELGGTTMKEEFSGPNPDIESMLTRLKDQQPDALFIDTQVPATAEKILGILQTINWKPQLFLSDIVPGDAPTVQRNATSLEGALVAEFSIDPTNARFQNLTQAYLTEYGAGLPYQSYAQTEYDAVYLVRDALVAVGEHGESVATWLRTVKNWPGASGSITIDQNGDREGGHTLKIIKGGVVQPAEGTPLPQ